MLVDLLVVAAGSAAGGAMRFAASTIIVERTGAVTLGTLAVNVVGSFVIGLVAALAPASPRLRLLATTGVCGGFTTFSAFSLETIDVARDGAIGLAVANIVLNVGLSIGACWAGWRIAAPAG